MAAEFAAERGLAGVQIMTDAAARVHLDDPHTIVISGLFFLAWGRKPA
jgi:hypothetical protein